MTKYVSACFLSGFIVHFEFRQLSKYYFIDPEWLNSVLALLVSPSNCRNLVQQPGFGEEIIIYPQAVNKIL